MTHEPAEQRAAVAEPEIELDVRVREALAGLLLTVADDEFVIGFWDSEWTGIAPMLEEDVATSSIAQDELGHARALYELLAELTHDDPDRIAYGRAADDFRHAALLNHSRGDWAFTVARRYLYESADAVRLGWLASSAWEPLAVLATKMRREETYHRLHVEAWVARLAGGTPESRERLAGAMVRLWPDAQEVFAPVGDEDALVHAGIVRAPIGERHEEWQRAILPALEPITGRLPDAAPTSGGRTRRTEDFRWLHEQFTMVARSEDGVTW